MPSAPDESTFPVPMYSHPVLPLEAAPVANAIVPLLPDVDAALAPSAVFSTSLPLDDAEPLPDVTNTSPPLLPDERPAANVRLPP